jgi:TonB family protein
MIMKRVLCSAVLLVALAMPSVAMAQVGSSSQTPQVQPVPLSQFLDVIKTYVDEGGYEEAEAMLMRALTAVRDARRVSTQPAMRFEPGGSEPLRVGGEIPEPRKLRDARPVYPEIAMAAKVQGIVILEIMIDDQGDVNDARVLRSVPLLDQAALDAVKQWRYTPTVLNGTPVPVIMTVTVNFTVR